MGIFKKAVRGVKKVIKGIAKGVKKVVKGVGKVFSKISQKLGPIGGILAGIALSFALPGIGTWIGQQWATFGAWAETISNPIVGGVMRGIHTIGVNIGSAYGQVKEFVGTISDKFQANFQDLVGSNVVANPIEVGGDKLISAASSVSTESLSAMSGSDLLTIAADNSWMPSSSIEGLGNTSSIFGGDAATSLIGDASEAGAGLFGGSGSTTTILGDTATGGFGNLGYSSNVGLGTPLGTVAEASTLGSGTYTLPTGLSADAMYGVGNVRAPAGITEGLGWKPGTTEGSLGSFDAGIGKGTFSFPESSWSTGTIKDTTLPLGKLAKGILGSTGIQPTITEAPEIDPTSYYKYGMMGAGGSGSTSWNVPYANKNYQEVIHKMAEQYRVYLRGLADRQSSAGV